ncbi:iron ABC transporter permease, partial [Cellulomonas bogoriensis 69B4 = DSM 16987]
LVGSLNARSWTHVTVLAVTLLALTPVLVTGVRWLRLLELGDDAARALGLPVHRAQLVLLVLAVALCAVAVATAGPVPFVALVAPQVARRLSPGAGIPLLITALVGAALMLAADLTAQRLLAPTTLPVGVATGVLGGVYLAWLLTREGRRIA